MLYSIVLASNWFPYVKKRILVVSQEQCELTPIQVSHTPSSSIVCIQAMDIMNYVQTSCLILFVVVVVAVMQVAIEAMDKKTRDIAEVVKMNPPDLKRLQLLLGGSISTQVNQGVQEYISFFRDSSRLPPAHVEQLKQMYR